MRRLAVLVPAVLLALSPLASAAPTLGAESGSGTQLALTTRSGVYTLSLLASAAPGGPSQLRVRLASSAGAITRLSGALSSAALTTSQGVTTLRTRLGAVPLVVVFRPQSAAAAVSFGDLESDDDATEGWFIVGKGGTADVMLGSARCQVDLMAVGSASVFDTAGYGGPLTRGLGVPLGGARCHSLPRQPLPVVP